MEVTICTGGAGAGDLGNERADQRARRALASDRWAIAADGG
jgi:hypothetical protein